MLRPIVSLNLSEHKKYVSRTLASVGEEEHCTHDDELTEWVPVRHNLFDLYTSGHLRNEHPCP